MPRTLSPLWTLFLALSLATGAAGQSGEVLVELDQFGVGGMYRPGDFVGVSLLVTPAPESAVDEAMSAWIQWEVPNADGDVAEYGRRFTLQRGTTRTVWLYAPLSPRMQVGDVWPVRVFAYVDGERGRELGGTRIAAPTGRINLEMSLFGTVGGRPLGLNQYRRGNASTGALVYTGSEDSALASLRPEDFPDRWEGLRTFRAIAWAGVTPQDLNSAQVEAIREWIRRGGHLIIALPEDSNPWGLGEIGRTEFEDILPLSRPRRDEDVAFSTVLPVLCKARGLEGGLDFPVTLQVFEDFSNRFDAIDNSYEPLIALPDGRVIVIQRVFGHGRITVVGLDLSLGRLSSLPLSTGVLSAIPQADVFWNRILGRRGDVVLGAEVAALEAEERLVGGVPSRILVGSGALFRQQINMSGAAGRGLLMALLLFGVYWFVAGPVGFFALKQYGRVQHAWLAFAAAAGLFTAAAWGGVQVLRQNDISVTHVTFLDHIARPDESTDASDPQLQRATAWLSVYLPGYGDTSIALESAEAEGRLPAQRDMLASWAPPGETIQTFPNVDRYVVDVATQPDDFALPTRSTSTQLYAQWLGGVPASWGGLLRSDPEDPIRVEIDANGNETLRGAVVNDLPGTLKNVSVAWVWNRRMPPRRYAIEDQTERPWIDRAKSGQMLNVGRMWREAEIVEDARYRLPQPTQLNALSENIRQRYVEEYEGNTTFGAATGAIGILDQRRFMEMLGIYDQLTPPVYMKFPNEQRPDRAELVRLLGHELDLSAWFNRPCLIIMGFLEDSSCPIPLRVDGEIPASQGLTVVRWVYPLPLEASIAFPQATAGSSAGGTGS